MRKAAISLTLLLTLLSVLSNSLKAQSDSEQIRNILPLDLEEVHRWSISMPLVIPMPTQAKLLSDGSLVIVDFGLKTINHFSREGDLISIKGGEGRGPGEYQNVSAVSVHEDGSIAIADISAAAITVSDIYSEERKRLRIDPGWNMALQWAGDQLVYSSHPFRIMGGNRGDIIFTAFDQTLETSDQIMRLELQRDNPPEDQISCMFCRFWFRDDLSFYTTPNDQRYLAYRVVPETGATFDISRESFDPAEYTDQELEILTEQRREASSRTGIEFDTSDLPQFKRMIVDMFIDHKDRLWIQRHSTDGTSTIFDLFDHNQEFLGSVLPPKDVRGILSVSGNRILFSLWDANKNPDTWSAAVYEIVEN